MINDEGQYHRDLDTVIGRPLIDSIQKLGDICHDIIRCEHIEIIRPDMKEYDIGRIKIQPLINTTTSTIIYYLAAVKPPCPSCWESANTAEPEFWLPTKSTSYPAVTSRSCNVLR